jgi:dihydrofolate reductase
MDDPLGEALPELVKPPVAMLPGRTTFNIFALLAEAGSKPRDPEGVQRGDEVRCFAPTFPGDRVNTMVVSGDVPAALRRLKAEDCPDMIVCGSGNLIQTLPRERLVDRMHLWTHPVTIGTGKQLFAESAGSARWKLVKSRIGDAGVIIATYEPAGELVTGTIGA